MPHSQAAAPGLWPRLAGPAQALGHWEIRVFFTNGFHVKGKNTRVKK